MTTLLTGASGFLGAHTVAALLERGERVRAFVRTPSRLTSALAPLGLSVDDDRIEVVEGQMTDAAVVRSAVEGCDAVVHAAATYSFRRADRAAMMRDNTAGTEAVLGAAREEGCRVAVHVSSTVALARPGAVTLDHRSPLGPGHGPYSDSKVASERIARRMQEAGDPVTIVNPGGVIGPHDPYLGETNEVLVQVLQGKQPVFPRGSPAVRGRARRGGGDRRRPRERAGRALPGPRARRRRAPRGAAAGDGAAAAGADRCPQAWSPAWRCPAT